MTRKTQLKDFAPPSFKVRGGKQLKDFLRELSNNGVAYGGCDGSADEAFYFLGVSNILTFSTFHVPDNLTEVTVNELRASYAAYKDKANPDGYICDKEYYGGRVKEGDVFVTYNMNSYMDQKTKMFILPKEIVEQWQPYYKKPDSIVLEIGVAKNSVVVFKDKIVANASEVHVNGLRITVEQLSPKLRINTWETTVVEATLNIGCWKGVKLSELKEILATYDSLQ